MKRILYERCASQHCTNATLPFLSLGREEIQYNSNTTQWHQFEKHVNERPDENALFEFSIKLLASICFSTL